VSRIKQRPVENIFIYLSSIEKHQFRHFETNDTTVFQVFLFSQVLTHINVTSDASAGLPVCLQMVWPLNTARFSEWGV
jgi:hypothetical protein